MIPIGSLFSGCGGLDLGIEAALAPYAETIWQVEKEPYARAVLAKHWPNAERFDDVKTVGAHNLRPCTILVGGFPCTEVSVAGKGEGLAGENSGLWWEMYRVICEIRPPIVIVENVPALVTRGLPTILGALSKAGYDAEWDCISAASQGAWHKRDRIFIIAYANGKQVRDQPSSRGRGETGQGQTKPGYDGQTPKMATAATETNKCGGWWAAEPSVGRVAHGIPRRVDRLKLLGNAVVPQVAYQVGLRVREVLGIEDPPGGASTLSNDPL
jgi:DNA (cytosine-5)-methyltransferase 1